MISFRGDRGFALPTIVIASLILMMVLVAALSTTTSTRTALEEQYYSQLAREAAEAGLVKAQLCLEANGGVAQWSASSPLTPHSDCAGNSSVTCPGNSSCYLVDSSRYRTTFKVGPAVSTSNYLSTGTTELVRSSDSTVTSTVETPLLMQISISVTPSTVTVEAAKIADGSTGSGGCVIGRDGQAYCWGNNNEGQLGNGTTTSSARKVVQVNGAGTLFGKMINDIAMGVGRVCASTGNSGVYCWGSNGLSAQYNLGDTSFSQARSLVPRLVPGSTAWSVASVGSGTFDSCASLDSGDTYCWGDNYSGTLGNGTVGSSSQGAGPTLVSRKFKKVVGATGQHVMCGIGYADNGMYCWGGMNTAGTNTVNSSLPVRLVPNNGGSTQYTDIEMGRTGCVIDSAKKLYCLTVDGEKTLNWQQDLFGTLAGKTFNDMSVYNRGICALDTDAEVWCWSANTSIQEYGSNYQFSPAKLNRAGIMGGRTVVSISGTCALTADSKVYCWDPTTSSTITPYEITLTDVSVSGGGGGGGGSTDSKLLY